jgi:hypothetical protein
MMKKFVLSLTLFLITLNAHSGWESQLRRLKGYTLVDVVTITGWIDKDGKRKDGFEGCDYGRIIILDYNKSLRCSSYGYQYAYNPDAFIFVKGGDFKMIVEGDSYDMSGR